MKVRAETSLSCAAYDGIGGHQEALGGDVLLGQPGDAPTDPRDQPAGAGLAVVLARSVVRDPCDRRRPRDVVQQAGDDETARRLPAARARERRAL